MVIVSSKFKSNCQRIPYLRMPCLNLHISLLILLLSFKEFICQPLPQYENCFQTKVTELCLSPCFFPSHLVWPGLVFYGLAWFDLVWSGLTWSGLVSPGLVWCHIVVSGQIRCDWSHPSWSHKFLVLLIKILLHRCGLSNWLICASNWEVIWSVNFYTKYATVASYAPSYISR